MKMDMLTWKRIEETRGQVPVTFSVQSPLEGEGGWVPQADPKDLEQLLEEFLGSLQNMNEKAGELQISTVFL